jgi:hypothetical protein
MVRRIRRDVRCDDIFGDVAIGRREVPSIFADDTLDRTSLSKLLELGAGHPGVAKAAGSVSEGDLHHSVGADIGERIDQDAVDDAEDRAGRANAQRQREDRRQRESRTTAQFARRIPEIADDRVHYRL